MSGKRVWMAVAVITFFFNDTAATEIYTAMKRCLKLLPGTRKSAWIT